MRRLAAAFIALPILATRLGACGDDSGFMKACTTMGCQSGFAVALQAGSWGPGSYEVTVKADDRTIVCTAVIPLPKGIPQSSCDASDVMLGTSGSELAVDQQSLYEVRFTGTFPKQVTLTVERDSTRLAEQTFTPEYKTLQPNGPECEPTCTYAGATMAW